jgi:hypothetical protein
MTIPFFDWAGRVRRPHFFNSKGAKNFQRKRSAVPESRQRHERPPLATKWRYGSPMVGLDKDRQAAAHELQGKIS